MSLKDTARRRTIDSFAAHKLKEPKKISGSLSDAVINCIANSSTISLNEVKKLKKARKF